MPVSGHEETGVKSFAGQFSGLNAGVPIKKRWWFSLNQSSSPLTEEPRSQTGSQTEETELQQKENSSTSQVSTTSNTSVAGAPIKKRWFPILQAPSPLEEGPPPEESDVPRKEHPSTSQGSTLSTSTSGLSDNNGIPEFEGRNTSTNATDANLFHSPKLEEPDIATQSCTLDVMDSKEKVMHNDDYEKKLGSHMITGNPELLLAAKQSLALNMGAVMSRHSALEICKQETAVVRGSTGLALSLKEHSFTAVTSTEVNESQKIGKAEPVSLELSLRKDDCTTQTSNSDAKIKSDTSHVHSNRANWDLNTTMDAWEESGTVSTSVKPFHNVVKTAGSLPDEKQLLWSTGLALPTGFEAVKKTNEDNRCMPFIVSTGQDGHRYKIDPQNLYRTPYLKKYAEEPSRISVTLNSGNAIPTANLTNVVNPAVDVSASSCWSVKPEPFDENVKRDLKESNSCPVGSVDSVSVKQEFVQHSSVESSNSSTLSNLKSVDPRFVKSEPSQEGKQERPKTQESKTDQVGKKFPQGSGDCSAVADPFSSEVAQDFLEAAVCLSELTTTHENIVQQLNNTNHTAENVEKVSPGPFSSSQQDPLESVAIPMVDDGTELSNRSMKDPSIMANQEIADDRDGCRLKLMNESSAPPRHSGEGCVSDEEKITLSAEEDSYCSEIDSDENHAVTVCVDTERSVEDDDYEDGEVREPLEHSTADDTICEVREVEQPDNINYENKQMENGEVISDCPTSSHALENDNKPVNHGEISCGEEDMDIDMPERPGMVVDKTVCLQESVNDDKPDIPSDEKQSVNLLHRNPLNLSERKSLSKTMETELYSNQATNAIRGVDAVQCADEVVKTAEAVRQTEIDLLKIEMTANTDDATKDISGGGSQGRIIDLSRAASSSSPSKTRPISGRSLPSRVGRDILSDTLDGDKIHRGRDEGYIDGPRKFSRERHQDMSPRNSRMNFVRGRGRVNSRLDSLRGEWESDREFSGEFYDGASQFRGPRPKYASAVDSDIEFNNVAPDGSYVGHGRIGRKPLNDGSYISPRRRSPGGRDGIQMGHRIPRTISPSRCIGGDGSEMGMRHGEKFMRGFPEDTMDSMFTRPQQFEGLEGRFARGGRNFSSMQRRGPPRIRSKSPIRSRSRSPGPWSSPPRRRSPRRSPDGFAGHPELNHRRSPLYRVDRMRSPDRPVFPGDRVVRRHGSPSYMSRPSNDIRDIGSARDHGHPRPVISNRSPSGRVLIRNRRFEVVDPRDRADNDDDYFAGPVQSGRILDLGNKGNGEERRRFGDRRGGHVRSFRPPYNNNVSENFHLNAEDGPRQYRFCSDDSDYHERSNDMRERDFDRRITGRPGNVPPRRTRNMDEPEENFRHGGHVWSDDSFDDISRVKRKRF